MAEKFGLGLQHQDLGKGLVEGGSRVGVVDVEERFRSRSC
jgi:hypothetical protein